MNPTNPLTEPTAWRMQLEAPSARPTVLAMVSLTAGSYQKIITDGTALAIEWRGPRAEQDALDPEAMQFIATLEDYYAVKWACRTWGYSIALSPKI